LNSIAVSPDGRSVYVPSLGNANAGTIAVLARDAQTGALRQLAGAPGCFQRTGAHGCAQLPALRGATGALDSMSVTVGHDGRRVHLAGDHGLIVFARNRGNGALTPMPGPGGCLRADGAFGCGRPRALSSADELALAPDRRSAYVIGTDDAGKAALSVFAVGSPPNAASPARAAHTPRCSRSMACATSTCNLMRQPA
jgi:hypothetical protein